VLSERIATREPLGQELFEFLERYSSLPGGDVGRNGAFIVALGRGGKRSPAGQPVTRRAPPGIGGIAILRSFVLHAALALSGNSLGPLVACRYVDGHEGLRSNHPGVVTRRNDGHIAGSEIELCPIVHDRVHVA